MRLSQQQVFYCERHKMRGNSLTSIIQLCSGTHVRFCLSSGWFWCEFNSKFMKQDQKYTWDTLTRHFLYHVLQVAMVPEAPHPFPTVDVPDHAHYTIGSVILAIGITGMVGNFLVIFAFCRYGQLPVLQIWSRLLIRMLLSGDNGKSQTEISQYKFNAVNDCLTVMLKKGTHLI